MSRTHAYCKVSICPVRAEASDRSELVTQLLFGEVVELLQEDRQWLKIRSFMDGYEGWIDSKQVQSLRDKEVSRWLDALVVEHTLFRQIEGPEGRILLPAGAFRPAGNDPIFNIGKSDYRFLDQEAAFPSKLIDFATSLLNTPYLWGGKTSFGIDCSGFSQLVYRVFDFQLPRDASQQVEVGQSVDFEDRQTGDLAFFITDSGTIHHVGILLNPHEIIHAHGYVRIDHFDKEGIVRKLDGVRSHRFYGIKRL